MGTFQCGGGIQCSMSVTPKRYRGLGLAGFSVDCALRTAGQRDAPGTFLNADDLRILAYVLDIVDGDGFQCQVCGKSKRRIEQKKCRSKAKLGCRFMDYC